MRDSAIRGFLKRILHSALRKNLNPLRDCDFTVFRGAGAGSPLRVLVAFEAQ
jgi:hypothetical protein